MIMTHEYDHDSGVDHGKCKIMKLSHLVLLSTYDYSDAVKVILSDSCDTSSEGSLKSKVVSCNGA